MQYIFWCGILGAEQCRVRQWLRMIELRTGGNAKVIMVASQSPKPLPYQPDYGRDRLPQDLADMIVAEIAIDSITGDNIPELQQLIAKHAASLPRMGDFIPGTWQTAREKIENLGSTKPYISYREFETICTNSGITDADQMFTLATVFMHNVGRAIYYGKRHLVSSPHVTDSASNLRFSSIEDPHLANFIVLDAEWLSHAFVQVLEDKATIDAGGLLDHSRLDVIWRNHQRRDWHVYSLDEHPYLIRMMHAFDMSYVVKGRDGKQSLVPQLLPSAEKNLPWKNPPLEELTPVRFIWKMEHEVLGLMPRFIVQTAPYHVFTHGSFGTFWQDGVFLREPTWGTEALVQLQGTEKPILTITVLGPQPAWFLGELYRTLSRLLVFWPGLDTENLGGVSNEKPRRKLLRW